MRPGSDPYRIELRRASALTAADLATLVAILKRGGAVNAATARQELPHAHALALASDGTLLVALEAIKRPRPDYTTAIRKRSGITFDPTTHELGYVAVGFDYRGNGLSHRILSALVSACQRPVLASPP